MESSMFKPSSMDLIRAGLQDLDKARALFDQLKADDIPDESLHGLTLPARQL